MTGKGWQSVGRTLIGEAHHYTFMSAVCTLRPASMPIIPTTFDTVVLAAIITIWGAVQAEVAMKVRLRVGHRYTHTVPLCRDAEQDDVR